MDTAAGIVKFWRGGVPIAPSSVAKALTPGAGLIDFAGIGPSILNSTGNNQGIGAKRLSQVMFTSNASVTALGTSGEAQAVADLHDAMLAGSMKLNYGAKAAFLKGDDDDAAAWNGIKHAGTGPTLSAAAGFVLASEQHPGTGSGAGAGSISAVSHPRAHRRTYPLRTSLGQAYSIIPVHGGRHRRNAGRSSREGRGERRRGDAGVADARDHRVHR